MKTTLLAFSLTVLAALDTQFSNAVAQGSLTPPGAPAPTMKTLDQIESRKAISAAPFTINKPGSYYLTTNLTINVGSGIVIVTNGVTLDFNGFVLSSTSPAGSGCGVYLEGGLKNITILNGHICGTLTNNGSGAYEGGGFMSGIDYSIDKPSNTRVSQVSVSGCYSGIKLGDADSTIVESCTVQTAKYVGITASAVRNSVATDCGSSAIIGGQVSDCRGESSGNGSGIFATTAQDCSGVSSTGFGILAQTVQNCMGSSSSGIGIQAATIQNCKGSSVSDYGIYAVTANSSQGSSTTGPAGMYAQTAAFCVGSRPSGTAIKAIVGNGCYATMGTNSITHKYNMP